MRSRYAAFALHLGDYLVATLARAHEDAALPKDALARELSRSAMSRRFMGLTIISSKADGDEGEVTFIAKIFERGRDVSFGECSRFVREDGAWRYASGTPIE